MKIFVMLYSFLIALLMGCTETEVLNTDIEDPTNASEIQAELVNPNLKNPWGMTFLPDGKILVTEKEGRVVLLENGEIIDNDVSGGPESTTQGQGGLLDIELHPDFESNRWVYFTYASNEGSQSGAMTALSRAQWNGMSFENHTVLYKGTPNTRASQHFGSRIAFDGKNHVYFSIGDRGNRDANPQDITRDGGKIYRLNDDGGIPADNPFVNENEAIAAIYSYGHRNPQGLARHPETGEIWEHEHGPQGGDEVNLIEAGANYGWPVITYGVNYGGAPITDETTREGMKQPVTYWVPSIAPCGMAFVSEDSVYEGWENNLIVGSLKFNYLARLIIEDNEVVREEKIAEGIGRVRNVEMGNDGYLYVGVEGGGIYRLTVQ